MKVKTLIFGLGLVFALTGCGELTPEQWSQLQQSTNHSNAQSTAAIVSVQVDLRGTNDIAFLATQDPNSKVFVFNITRLRGSPTAKSYILTSVASQPIYQFMTDLFSGAVTVQSRVTCPQCTNWWGTLTLNRSNASSQQYNFPLIQNSNLADPLNQLSQFLLTPI